MDAHARERRFGGGFLMKSVRIGVALSFALMGFSFSESEASAQVANSQTDARDYEVLSFLPSNAIVPLTYFREVSSSDTQSYSQSEGIFRAAYILKF
ncbi:MAG TPA: hypothetical protein VH044_03260, partial [Polyangiaceae bacterium]|nr:hypothetical protein [Polyangiaceae bacterium]